MTPALSLATPLRRAGALLRNWRQRRRLAKPAFLATYTQPSQMRKHRVLLLLMLTGFALFYGAAFGLTTTYFLIQLCVPLALLAGLAVWLLPETEAPPLRLLSRLLFVFLAVLLIWPDYLAITLPGMPWITASRLIGVPLALTLLVSLSVSSKVREAYKETLAAVPWVWKLLVAFMVLVLLSIAASTDPAISANKLTVAAINWFVIFFVAVFVFRLPGRALTLAYLLWGIAIFDSLVGIQEWRHSVVPWAGHIPSFLAVQDESVQRILAGSARAATGIYRVQSKFTTSLGLAEFYALAIPFIIHFAFRARTPLLRALAALTLPFLFWMILLTDSRLGVVGFLLGSIFYLAVWATWRRRRHPESVVAPAVLLLYPIIFTAFITATFFVGRLRSIVWGSGAQQASDDSRKLQVAMAMPKIFSRPWGYGMGRGGETLGFTNGNGIMTIDSYYLTVALEYGIIGFVIYYAMFVNGIWNGARRLNAASTPETELIAPVTISLINFVVIKAIFSQQDNHALVFALLGALVALCWRADNERRSSQA